MFCIVLCAVRQGQVRQGGGGGWVRRNVGGRPPQLPVPISSEFHSFKRVSMKKGLGKVTRIAFKQTERGLISMKSGKVVSFPYDLSKIKTQFLTIGIIMPKNALCLRLNPIFLTRDSNNRARASDRLQKIMKSKRSQSRMKS